MKKILIFFNLFLSIISLYSQEFEITWQNCFGGTYQDYATDIIATEGGYLLVGTTNSTDGDISFNHGGDDLWVIKIDTLGNMIWEKCLGGTKGDGGRRIFPTKDGNYYILAGAYSSDGDISNDPYPNSVDYWIIKINPEGDIIWEKIVGSSKLNQISSGIATNDGGVIAIGWSSTNDGDMTEWYGYYDMWMIKLDSTGSVVWDFTLGGSDFDIGYDIIQTNDGGYLVAGSAIVEPGGNLECNMHDQADAILVKLDSARNIEWQKCYGGSDYDGATRILEINDGYLFSGYTSSFDGDVSGFRGDIDIWVVKVDYSGDIVWQKCLGGSDKEFAQLVFPTNDSGYMVIGYTNSHDGDVLGNNSLPQSYDNDIWIVKLDKDGNFIWQQCIGGTRDESITFGAIKKDSENYILAGHSNVATGDVQCELHSYLGHKDFWVFEIKDCSLYAPQTPSQPTGPDTLCYTNDSTSTYSISPAAKAWGYEWKIEPENAGNLIEDSLLAYVEWNQQYEGESSISSRSYNDCGSSDWSEVKKTQVYNCVGMEEIGSGNVNIRVYPNPAIEKLVVGSWLLVVGDANIQVFDVLGQKVEDIKIPKGQDKTEIDVSTWQKGLYFVKAQFENGGFGCVKVVVE